MDLVIQSFIEIVQTMLGITPHMIYTHTDTEYGTSMTINGEKYYFFFDLNLIELLAHAFLESKPTQNEIKDLCQEFTNLIIGKAKVLNTHSATQIGIPIFLNHAQVPNLFSKSIHFQIKEGRCSIYKE
ncbi:chemotaxis protein CheX [Helicobacter kayseriensis]|uniref:chemotaxis protein CheX n=1 Tax=Helicobacter kayseriensis TaxID=2905877 RepID=UPI001E338ECB|nr:chemotaxis protein CheX [Helicobacter kayseriensis]MCE3047427.1 chemotaxis protein CheX [Helicobacter kayseriensis]MCE3048902.1 chemotaxis protein CheX [Helicobacter kayseriensis]